MSITGSRILSKLSGETTPAHAEPAQGMADEHVRPGGPGRCKKCVQVGDDVLLTYTPRPATEPPATDEAAHAVAQVTHAVD